MSVTIEGNVHILGFDGCSTGRTNGSSRATTSKRSRSQRTSWQREAGRLHWWFDCQAGKRCGRSNGKGFSAAIRRLPGKSVGLAQARMTIWTHAYPER